MKHFNEDAKDYYPVFQFGLSFVDKDYVIFLKKKRNIILLFLELLTSKMPGILKPLLPCTFS